MRSTSYVIRLNGAVIYRSYYSRAATDALARFKRTNKAVFKDTVLERETRSEPRKEYTVEYAPFIERPRR